MLDKRFRLSMAGLAAAFTILFAVVVIPALIDDPDVPSAFASGFVNPFAAGYSMDVIFTWMVLAVWVLSERRAHGVRGGWIALLLGVVPGVAVGLAVYLLIRQPRDHQTQPEPTPAPPGFR
jgi:uncharacterized membrane protein